MKVALTTYASLGTSRCVVGASADFPGLVLVTIASSSGSWSQIAVDPERGVDQLSLNTGDSYQAAGIDESSWASGYTCAVVNGDIVLSP